jgi:cytidylate kinase
MEGRDIGTVVFPETPFKFYIDASEEVRAQRRAAEGQRDEVGARDRQDAQRKTSPLKVAEGAMVIDSSEMGIEDVVDAALAGLRERGWFAREGVSR